MDVWMKRSAIGFQPIPRRWGGRPPHGIDVPDCGLLRPTQKGPSATSIIMIGLDTAKAVFHVHGVNESGKAELRRKLRRSELIGFFEVQPACTVVLEACGAAHHWGRVLSGLGHTVKLIAPEAVRPFIKRGRKNDAVDAVGAVRGRPPPGGQIRAGKRPGAAEHAGAAHGPRAAWLRYRMMAPLC
jgi:hypothetical protein